MRCALIILLLLALSSGCTHPDPAPVHASRTPVLTLGISMTPKELIDANPDFPFGESMYGASKGWPQGIDDLHDLVILPSDPKMSSVALSELGGGTIVSLSGFLSEHDEQTGSIPHKVNSFLFSPARGDGYARQTRSLVEAYRDLQRASEALTTARWEPLRFRYESDAGEQFAVGMLPLEELQMLWRREKPMAPPAVVLFRSGDVVVQCNLGFTRSDSNEDQQGDAEYPQLAVIERPVFSAMCNVGDSAGIYPQSILE